MQSSYRSPRSLRTRTKIRFLVLAARGVVDHVPQVVETVGALHGRVYMNVSQTPLIPPTESVDKTFVKGLQVIVIRVHNLQCTWLVCVCVCDLYTIHVVYSCTRTFWLPLVFFVISRDRTYYHHASLQTHHGKSERSTGAGAS